MKIENDWMEQVLLVMTFIGFMLSLGAVMLAAYYITFFED